MDLKLAYGNKGLAVHLEDTWNTQVVEPRFIPGLEDPVTELREGLRHPIDSDPLTKWVKPASRVGIIVNTITRPTPIPLLLRAVLDELAAIPPENITLFIATGTHRPNNPEELEGILGAELVKAYRIEQNNAIDNATLGYFGQTSRGHPIWLNRLLMECDFKILIGFIEPHFFASFSGAGKEIMPVMAGLETILGNHCARHIANPQATWEVTWWNPIWEEI
jgi:nickel-dependent lactate racemase